MRHGRFTEDQIIAVFAEQEAGLKTKELCRTHWITDATFYKWKARFGGMRDARLAGAFFSNAGGATPVNSNAMSWNADMVTTTGNVVVDLLHNFHLECGARLHKLRVYETLSDPTGREVCGYRSGRNRRFPGYAGGPSGGR